MKQFFISAAIIFIALFATYHCYQVIYMLLLLIFENAADLWSSLGRKTYTIRIRRFEDDLHVESMIDTVKEISYLKEKPYATCKPKQTLKDFTKVRIVYCLIGPNQIGHSLLSFSW